MSAHLANQPLHAGHGKVDVNRKSRAQMLEHSIALFRLGFEQELVDNHGRVVLFAQACGSLLQDVGPMGFVAGRQLQSGGALLAAS